MKTSALAFTAALTLGLAGCGDRGPASPAEPEEPRFFISGSDAGYLPPATCAGCHAEIYETYSQTGMGRSFFQPQADRMIADFAKDNSYYHEASDRHYTMFERDGKFFQRRHQIGFGGAETNVVEKEIHFVMGSGNHTRTYLHRTKEGKVIELPVAWYSEKGGFWAMNPGYNRPDHQGFLRAIPNDCMFCHNGYPELPPGGGARGADPVFPGRLPEGVDCQRCHGPGRDHVAAATEEADEGEIRAKIFNPSSLDPERQLELCMQCHLESTSRMLPYSLAKFERPAFSYRPWERLSDHQIHFDYEPGKGPDDHFEIAHAAYRFRKSACFQESEGELVCTTCHNPHDVKRGAEAREEVAQVCLDCHTQPHTDSRDCVSCHMPKRRTDDVVHVVMTDHYIRQKQPPGDLLAPIRETHDGPGTAYQGEVVLYYPPELPNTPENELYLALAQVIAGANLKGGVPRLASAVERHQPDRPEFYHHLAEAYWKSGEIEKAIPMYERALVRDPDHLPSLRNLGATLREAGRLAEAVRVLNRAGKDAIARNNLGQVYLMQGRAAQSKAVLDEAISINPDLPEAWNNLGEALVALDDRDGAIDAWRNAVRIQPSFATARSNLANNLDATGSAQEAEFQYKKAVAADPDLALVRYNFGTMLAGQQRFQEAAEQLEAATRLDPGMAEAHLNLGNVYAVQGQPERAIPHFQRAVETRPGSAQARLNLGVALATVGRIAEATGQFREAEKVGDEEAKALAGKALEQLGAR